MSKPTERADAVGQVRPDLPGPGPRLAVPAQPEGGATRVAQQQPQPTGAVDVVAPEDVPRDPPPPSPPPYTANGAPHARRPGDAGRVLAGRYELRRRIGSGGMASVWQATDRILARSVAVKLLHEHLADDEAFRERFRREAIASARLTHASIVGLYDTGTDQEQEFLVMEYVEGVTLRDLIAGTDGLPAGPAAAIACRIGQGLAYAHMRGLVHRDVKPANILIADDGGMKITDFGIAKADHGDDLTSTGMVLGTAAYVAPEQILAEPIDGQADQYALACVLYEALTAKQPFRGDTAVATAAARLEREVPSVRALQPEVPLGLDAIVARGMARDPGDRFPSIGDFADALLAFVDADTDRTAAFAAPVASLVASARSAREAPTPVPTLEPGPPSQDITEGDDTDPTVTTPVQSPPAIEPDVPAAPPPGSTQAPRGGDRRRGLRALLVVLLIALTSGALAFGLVGSGLLERPGRSAGSVAQPEPSRTPSSAPSPPPRAPSVAVPLAASALSVIDPAEGGKENDDELPNMVDGDEDTFWRTEGYETPADFRNLKDGRGVAVVADLGGQRAVTAVELDVAYPGVDVQVLGATRRPTNLDAATVQRMQPLGEVADAPRRAVVQPGEAVTARYLVVRLRGGLQPDGFGTYVRGGFSELRVEATETG